MFYFNFYVFYHNYCVIFFDYDGKIYNFANVNSIEH
jgi:hypothetical protein